jgi:hypothetical protein
MAFKKNRIIKRKRKVFSNEGFTLKLPFLITKDNAIHLFINRVFKTSLYK